jgi:2-methylcitrate dehydratase PrpD
MAAEPRTGTQVLADYIVASRDVPLPADLIERMRLLVLDTVGCGVHGARLPWSRAVARAVTATQPPGPALVWGTATRLGAVDAALVNGTSVHAFELDDVGAGGHHGSTTLTVALALAESGHPLSGAATLRAVAAGIEVAARVSECLGPEPQVRCGFHLPSVIGTFAAAATASSVLGLDSAQCRHALGTAAQLASGLMGTQHGGMGKRLAAGNAAQAGLRAAQLAAYGVTSTDDIFECGYGSFPAAFSGGRPTYDLTKLVDGLDGLKGRDDLGARYRGYDVNIKLWACRVPIHASLEAMTSLARAYRFDPSEIASVRVALPTAAHQAVGFRYVPGSAASAQLNLRYCVAVLLLQGDVFLDEFADELLARPDLLALVERIEVIPDPGLDGSGGGFTSETVVQVTLTSGQTMTAKGRVRGPHHEPVTRADVVAKFGKTTGQVLDEQRRGQIVEACAAFDRIADVTAFCRLLGEAADPAFDPAQHWHPATVTG